MFTKTPGQLIKGSSAAKSMSVKMTGMHALQLCTEIEMTCVGTRTSVIVRGSL